jgi:hypothetical protein
MESARLLAKLADYPVTKWFNKAIKELAKDLRTLLSTASGVLSGGVVSFDSATATTLLITSTALDTKINGVLKAQLAAISVADDLFDTAGPIGQAIYEDGSDASAIDLTGGSGNTAWVKLIATDSDGGGGATGEDGAVILVAVVAGTSATFQDQTQVLTDAEVRTALLNSTGVHDGANGFVGLADILWDEGTSSPTATVTVNRDA